jgi:hypothetical protein
VGPLVVGIGVQHSSEARQWCRFGAGNGNASTVVMIMQRLHIRNIRKPISMKWAKGEQIFAALFTSAITFELLEGFISDFASSARQLSIQLQWKLVPWTTSLDLVIKHEFCKLVVTMILRTQSEVDFRVLRFSKVGA